MERLYTKKKLNVGSAYMLGTILDCFWYGSYWVVIVQYDKIPDREFHVYQV